MTPWMKGVPPLAHFMPGNDDFTLKPWLVKPLQQKTTHMGREISKRHDMQMQEYSGEYVWNDSEQIY